MKWHLLDKDGNVLGEIQEITPPQPLVQPPDTYVGERVRVRVAMDDGRTLIFDLVVASVENVTEGT